MTHPFDMKRLIKLRLNKPLLLRSRKIEKRKDLTLNLKAVRKIESFTVEMYENNA